MPRRTPEAGEADAPAGTAKRRLALAAEAHRAEDRALPRPSRRLKSRRPTAPLSVSARRDSDGLHLTFSFAAATPAALFRRADTVWLVFDSTKPIDIAPIRSNGGAIIADVSLLPLDKGQAIRIRLNRPQMPSLAGDDQDGGANWTLTFSDTMQTPTQPLTATRNITDPALANVTVALAKPGRLHRLVDPDAGDTLLVVTAPPPVRGFIKRQDFVEMSLLESIHGVAIRPNSDDVTAEIALRQDHPRQARRPDAVIGRRRAPSARRPRPGRFSMSTTGAKTRQQNFIARQDALIAAAAAAGGRSAHAGADRSCALLSGARDVSGSQGHARSRAGRRQAGRSRIRSR